MKKPETVLAECQLKDGAITTIEDFDPTIHKSELQAMHQFAELVSEEKLGAMIDYLRENDSLTMNLPTKRYVELFLTSQDKENGISR